MKKGLIIGGVVVVLASAVLLYIWAPWKNLENQIAIPYIAHQKPSVDPHLPSSVSLSDKLDEVIFDGLFNVSANPSGITYENGLGELVEISPEYVVTVRLKPKKKWHRSYDITVDEDENVKVEEKTGVFFTAQDLNFTLRRIQRLGSLSPDYLLLTQSMERLEFTGPDENYEIQFRFKPFRVWTEDDVKEMLSFKILPYDSDMLASQYSMGTGPFMAITPNADISNYVNNPSQSAEIDNLNLKPYIDNSTFTTELNNTNFNVLLTTPFGSLSPILEDPEDFFFKSNISTTYFALLFNTERLNRQQRTELRKLINNKTVMDRFYKVGTEQQRHIADYKGNKDNYDDYLNHSVFPSSSYYVDGDDPIIVPLKEKGNADLSVLPDSIIIQANLNYGFREEYSELLEIFNDRNLFNGKLRARAVKNEDIKNGNYDAVLIAINGYSSNFFYDLYSVFLREPNLALHKVNLVTDSDGRGNRVYNTDSFQADKNFFRLDLSRSGEDYDDTKTLLEYIYGFMSTRRVYDRQEFASRIDMLDQNLALGAWLFSLPSTAYFSTQFDEKSIDLYGVASQLSTIEKWQEKKEE
ncbi:MAG: hypothetical protein D8M58_13415 [Calditrichaeota bacterium]|nr:MAG: hypothetical protein DWQ03_00380 [Calditrichota bacterium]MBL1206397.1 hypothetical protein [Calditrichota bacterium]NOG46223.1 hypothetical protein [Calditrichota bacterium]